MLVDKIKTKQKAIAGLERAKGVEENTGKSAGFERVKGAEENQQNQRPQIGGVGSSIVDQSAKNRIEIGDQFWLGSAPLPDHDTTIEAVKQSILENTMPTLLEQNTLPVNPTLAGQIARLKSRIAQLL